MDTPVKPALDELQVAINNRFGNLHQLGGFFGGPTNVKMKVIVVVGATFSRKGHHSRMVHLFFRKASPGLGANSF